MSRVLILRILLSKSIFAKNTHKFNVFNVENVHKKLFFKRLNCWSCRINVFSLNLHRKTFWGTEVEESTLSCCTFFEKRRGVFAHGFNHLRRGCWNIESHGFQLHVQYTRLFKHFATLAVAVTSSFFFPCMPCCFLLHKQYISWKNTVELENPVPNWGHVQTNWILGGK